MKHPNPDFYGLPLELLGRHLRQELYAAAERERLLRQLTRRAPGQAPWRAVAGWVAAHVNGSASPRTLGGTQCSRPRCPAS